MRIVTSGINFMDIDAYASSVAYAELLNLQDEEAVAACSSLLNASVTPTIQSWGAPFKLGYTPSPDDTFVIVDASVPTHLDECVDIERVDEVIDHHPGMADYWQARLGERVHIEMIGAASTLIYERWEQSGKLDQMSQTSARLLVCGILDNTLNLEADITAERDRAAYADLVKRADLPDNWPEQYFRECQKYIVAHTEESVESDAKTLQYPTLADKTHVGQLALWDAQNFLHDAKDIIQDTLASKKMAWYMNLIDIHSGTSIFWCKDPGLQHWLANLLSLRFDGDLATANRMWLRKEIMEQAIKQQDATTNR